MVIGVLTTSYPRWSGDFAGAFVADRVRALVAAGHRVEVLAGGGPATAELEGVGVIRLPSRFGDGPDLFGAAGAPEALEEGRIATLLAAARFSAALAAATRARAAGWDAIESHWLAPSALAGIAGAPHLPHRAFAHSGDVALLERLPFGLGRILAARLAASGAELSFVSEALRARFARLAGRGIGRVEALSVPDAFRSARRRAGPGRRVVISVGRLVPIKGHDLLIRACARGGSDARVVILGAGPEAERLRALAARLGVPLQLPGSVSRADVASHLGAADLYVQPSRVLPNGRTEGLPVATLEALAVGLPVVASSAGGLVELARGTAQVALVPPNDVPALAAAIRRHLDRIETAS